jgi:acyl-CoA reductase-like NAD-dependent aldehyde dehydrogenase
MTATQDWFAQAAALQADTRPLIGGTRVDLRSTETLARVSPADGRPLGALAIGSDADADAAVGAARAMFDSGVWSDMAPLFRKGLLMALADAIDRNRESLALWDSVEMGKPIGAALGDAFAAAHIFRFYAEFADKPLASAAPTAPSLIQYGRREPRGVVAAITPWNYPLPNAALKAAPAMAAGNCVVLKPSELSPSSALKLAELALEVGIPPGVLNVVPGLGRTVGAALAAHPGVDFVAFTGSTATGRELMRLVAGSGLKPLQLECGGKSANLVFPDIADLDAVARDAAHRIFDNGGQLCVAGTRLICHRSLKDELVERIVQHASSLKIGHPLDPETTYGPLASQARMQAVLDHCDAGRTEGATLRHGGERLLADSGGFYVAPTVFENAPAQGRLAQQDIFGPVLTVMAFDTDDEAVQLANDTPYGLSATVWTRDLSRAGAMAHRLKVGRATVLAAAPNSMAFAFPMAAEPYGQSGFGAEAGREGFEAYTRLKAVEMHL